MFSKLKIKFKIFISRTDPSAVAYSHNQTLKSSENKHTVVVPNTDEFHKCKGDFVQQTITNLKINKRPFNMTHCIQCSKTKKLKWLEKQDDGNQDTAASGKSLMPYIS